MKTSPSAESRGATPWRALAVTLAAPLVLLFGQAIVLPGVDAVPLTSVSKGASELRAYANMSVMTLGIVPLVTAILFVELVALVVPRWSALRHAGPSGRAKLGWAALSLAIVLAAFQALGIATFLEAANVLIGTKLIVMATLVGGTFALAILAAIVDRFGLTSGFALLSVSSMALAELDRFVRPAGPADSLSTSRAGPITLGGTAALVVCTVVALGWSRNRGGTAGQPKGSGAPRILIPASGIVPLQTTLGLLAVPATLVAYGLGSILGLGALSDLLKNPSLFLPAYLGIALLLGWVLSIAFNHPALAARIGNRGDLAETFGTRSDDPEAVRAYDATSDSPSAHADPRAEIRRAIPMTLAFLVAAILVPEIAERLGAWMPRTVAVVLATALGVDLVREWRARGRAGQLVAVWPEHRPYAIAAARTALGRAGIPMHARSASFRTMLQLFGPHVPIEIFVTPKNAKRARAILEGVLPTRPVDQHLPLAPAHATGPRASSTGPRPVSRPPARAKATIWSPGASLGIFGIVGVLLAGALTLVPTTEPNRSRKRHHPPDAARAAALAFVPVDDDVDPFQGFQGDPPRGVRIELENAPVGAGRTRPIHYARIVMVDGEPLDAALARARPWFDGFQLPEGRRFAFQKAEEFDDDRDRLEVTGWRSYVLQGPPIMTGADVADARAMESTDTFGGVYIALEFSSDGARRFEDFTRGWVKRRFAILVSGEVMSAPVVQSAIAGGHASITLGSSSRDQQLADARKLAEALTGPE